jgi:hypothetical protein
VHKPIPVFMIRHHWPPELHRFSSLVAIESYAYSHIFRYKSQFFSGLLTPYSHQIKSGVFSRLDSLSKKPYKFIFHASPSHALFENRFWYLWCFSVLYYRVIEIEICTFRNFFQQPE